MSIANYLKGAAYAATGLAVASPLAQQSPIEILANSAHAQETATKAPVVAGYIKHGSQTVEDMLKGSRIQKVDIPKYDQMLKSGNVMTFLYENSVDSPSSRLATVMLGLSERFPDMTFIALERKNSIKGEFYLERGYELSPDFMLYSSGKLIYRNPSSTSGKKGGGPNKGYELAWIGAIEGQIKKALDSNKVSSLN